MKITRVGAALAATILLSEFAIQPALAHTSGGMGGGGHGGGGFHGGSGGHSFAGHSFAGHGGAFHGTQNFAAHGFAGGGVHPVGVARAGFGHGVVASAGFRGRTFVGGGFRGGFHGGFGRGVAFRGGYWGGRFWPGVFYGAGFLWFLPTLPLYCSTYWWEGVPYYYYNDAYYTWSPSADGYVATDPPPAATTGPADDGSGANASYDPAAGAPPAQQAGPPQGAGPQSTAPQNGAPQINDNVYAYPGNGQTEDQQASDRQQCDQWASTQAGTAAPGSPDFRRAVIACFQGRGYSAQ
jgi:hypothetical protein